MWQESCRRTVRAAERLPAAVLLGAIPLEALPARAAGLDGRALSEAWGLPFAGLLLATAPSGRCRTRRRTHRCASRASSTSASSGRSWRRRSPAVPGGRAWPSTSCGVAPLIQEVARDLAYMAATGASLALTPPEARRADGFAWGRSSRSPRSSGAPSSASSPSRRCSEVGREGALAPLVGLVARPDGPPSPAAAFRRTGGLSALLDDAPTDLVFFDLAGGDAAHLMGREATTLAVISCGAVFMGALADVGNAPN